MTELAPGDGVVAGADAAHPSVDPFEERCANCGAALFGPFCAQCGQEAREADPTVNALLREGWEEFTSVDGKLMRTLRVLFTRPGQLTLDYVAGQRVRYAPPLKLYLWLSVLYFFVSALAPASARPVRMTRIGPSRADTVAATASLDSAASAIVADSSRWIVTRRLHAGLKRAVVHQDEFAGVVKEWVPRAVFALVPASAVLLALVYRRRGLRYPRHFAFALHVHAFTFGALLAGALLGLARLPRAGSVVAALAMVVWLPAYLVVALRRVYGGRLGAAVGRAMLLMTLYVPLFLAGLLVAIAAALVTL